MKKLNLFEDKGNGSDGITSESLNLVEMQLKMLRYCGVIVPDKGKIIFFLITAITYILVFSAIIAAIPPHWGIISTVTAIVFQLIVFLDTVIATVYLLYNQSQFLLLFHMIDTHFMKFINNTVSSTNRATIITKIKRKSKTFSNLFLTVYVFVVISWACFPYITKIVDTATDNIVAEDGVLIYKYFCAVIWSPKDVLKFPIYEMHYLFQVACLLLVTTQYTARNIIFFFFMYYTAAHFDLLLSCIEDIDEKFPEENTDVLEEMVITDDNETYKRVNSSYVKVLPVSPEENLEHIQNYESVKVDDIPSSERKRIGHLIECIKYHQSIIE